MKHPIPLKHRLFRRYKGCPKQSDDFRDIKLGDIPYKPDPNCPSWEEGFSNEKKYGKLKREHQGSSSSCVSQGWSKYLEMINKIEETWVDLSARDIYSQIYLPNGGAYIRSGAKIAVNKGNCEEDLMNSYLSDGSPPNEAFIRTRESGTEDNALIYKAKRFVHIDVSHPLTNKDWENIRQVIWQFGGFVGGLRRHCMFASEYKLINNKRAFRWINSYGEGSDRWYIEGSKYETYDITFLYDMPNPPLKIYMEWVIKNKEQFLLYPSLKIALNIGDEIELKRLQENGLSGTPKEIDSLDGYTIYPLVAQNRLKDLFGIK